MEHAEQDPQFSLALLDGSEDLSLSSCFFDLTRDFIVVTSWRCLDISVCKTASINLSRTSLNRVCRVLFKVFVDKPKALIWMGWNPIESESTPNILAKECDKWIFSRVEELLWLNEYLVLAFVRKALLRPGCLTSWTAATSRMQNRSTEVTSTSPILIWIKDCRFWRTSIARRVMEWVGRVTIFNDSKIVVKLCHREAETDPKTCVLRVRRTEDCPIHKEAACLSWCQRFKWR